jgi:hypothetical protein
VLTGYKYGVVVAAFNEGDLFHEFKLFESGAGPRVLAQPELALGVGAAHEHPSFVCHTHIKLIVNIHLT